MEFRYHFQAMSRYRGFLMSFVLIVALSTFFFSLLAEPQYVASLSFTVNRINRQETADYQFDGYYAIQASDLLSQTLLSWFLTPSVLLEIYQRAGLDPHIDSINELTGRFRARKFSPQNLVVNFSELDPVSAEKLAQAIGEVVKERAHALNQTSEGQAIFEVVPATPVIVKTEPNIILNTVAALASSILIGLALVAILRYLRA